MLDVIAIDLIIISVDRPGAVVVLAANVSRKGKRVAIVGKLRNLAIAIITARKSSTVSGTLENIPSVSDGILGEVIAIDGLAG